MKARCRGRGGAHWTLAAEAQPKSPLASHGRLRLLAVLPLLALGVGAGSGAELEGGAAPAAQAIRVEATRAPRDGAWPLPLAGHWNTLPTYAFDPSYQMRLIAAGHHLLPAFWLQPPAPREAAVERRYFEGPIQQAAQQRLPLSFLSTQWESRLLEPPYAQLPPDQNPCVVGPDGEIRLRLSPVGPKEAWYRAGKEWTSTKILRELQEWYPDPPLVLFVSNNEAPRGERGEDRRAPATPMPGEGFPARYRSLIQGMRDGLVNAHWKERARFVGYGIEPAPAYLGRWGGWRKEHGYIPGGLLNPGVGVWDGGSASYYTHNWQEITDFRVWSPQIEAMNWIPFLERETYVHDPDWWQEISTWDGDWPGRSKRDFYVRHGQAFSPERYAGMVQFGMWLVQPRLVREFRLYKEHRKDQEAYFRAILAAVDRVYANPVLSEFWRGGRLVPNPAHPHPYATDLPPAIEALPRWFLLDTNLDPERPWALRTEIPVFSLVRELGAPPQRRWLLYAHAPLGPRANVRIRIPGYGPVAVDVPVGGSFHLVDEGHSTVTRVADGSRANHNPRTMLSIPHLVR